VRAEIHRSVAALAAWYETLTPESLARVGEHYAANAWFKDPFNEASGLDAIRRVFAHMFAQLEEPRFSVHERVINDEGALLTWELGCRLRGRALRVHGASHLKFNGRGKVVYHRDYWDTGEELYAKLPVLGALMRWLRRRLSATR
jgi:steroid Delta-isomerase